MNEPNSRDGLPLPTQSTSPKPDDGGPAFPRPEVLNLYSGSRTAIGFDGMSLRDWFAGQALSGVIAVILKDSKGHPAEGFPELDKISSMAWDIADNMINARQL